MPGPFPINTTIPFASNDPADDQPEMQLNFLNIDSWLKIDHVDPATANAGYHKQATMPNQTPPAGVANAGIYFVQSGAPWFVTPAGTALPIGGAVNFSANGYATLWGGLIVQWGVIPAPGASGSINFPLNPFPNTVFTVVLCPQAVVVCNPYVLQGSPTTAGFGYQVFSTPATLATNLFWIALGN